jgi:hypothetical protein
MKGWLAGLVTLPKGHHSEGILFRQMFANWSKNGFGGEMVDPQSGENHTKALRESIK